MASSAGFLYAFVGRCGAREVWAEHAAPTPPGARPLANPQRTAVQMLQKLSDPGKFNFEVGAKTCYALVEAGACYGCITGAGVGANAGMMFLSDVMNEFKLQYGQSEREQAMASGGSTMQFRGFGTSLGRIMGAAGGGGSGSMQRVQTQIEQTRNVMATNIDKVLQRGEDLDSVVDKSSKMVDSANVFRKKGVQLREQLWWTDMRFKIAIAAAVLLLIVVIFFAVCRGISCVT